MFNEHLSNTQFRDRKCIFNEKNEDLANIVFRLRQEVS
jgi:hypothetical protein